MSPHAPVLLINALEEELDDAAAFCHAEGLGLEVTAFAFAAGLDDGFDPRVRRHADTLAELRPLSFHGPFIDLYPTSPDPRVAAVARDRHERALEAAAAIGVSLYVAHLNSLPLIRNRAYRDRFATAAAAFWRPLAERAGRDGITIALENMWEDGPELQARVVEETGHPNLRASFDNGHARVFSSRPAADWISGLGPHLGHVHLHDNDGSYDQHRPIGDAGPDGEDWPPLLAALDRHAPGAAVVLESDRLDENRRSLQALRDML
jgi:sugar phosphate isomerase/epimerase